MNKKKILTTALLSVLTLSACGSIAYVSTQNNKNDFISNQLDSNIVEKGISVKCAVVEDPTATYGAQKFTYSVFPDTQYNNVLYKINYKDGSVIEDNILKITHDSENKSIQVNCNSIFTKQIVLTIYLEHNENIKAEVTIDFVEIVDINYGLKSEEGQKLEFWHEFESTGGSITIPRTITNKSIKWSDRFVNEITESFLNSVEIEGYDSSTGSINYESSTLFNSDMGVNYFFNNNYNTWDFVALYTLCWESDTEICELSLVDLSNFSELSYFFQEDMYEYSFTWNGENYSERFGVYFDETQLYADTMLSEVSNLRFGGEVSSTNNDSNELRQIFSELDTTTISVSSSTPANNGSSSFVYTSLDRFENKIIKRIGLPIKTLSDYTQDNIYSIHLISQDITSEEKFNTYELKINANTYSSNTINKWVYFDVNIAVPYGQTLGFGSSTDTIQIGCYSTNPITEDCSVYNKIVNGVADDHKTISSKILLDIYY